jgi:hypothetical protein
MTGKQQRRSVSDRARRRAIRAYAARLGVSYSVAARLLTAQMSGSAGSGPGGMPTGADEHRAWLFAMRERRSFDLRVRDTRLAADLPLGRAAHLAERFPPLRGSRSDPPSAALYDGEGRQATLAMLYAVLAHESPALPPTADELAWVAELGEEAAVDITCGRLDRAARLLLDDDRWHLWTRIEAALVAGEASPDRRVRDAATTLGQDFRAMTLRRSLGGARHTLDAVLVTAHGAHPPGTQVRILTGPGKGRAATVVGVRWSRTGPPNSYQLRAGADPTIVDVDAEDVVPLDQPAEPEPALT